MTHNKNSKHEIRNNFKQAKIECSKQAWFEFQVLDFPDFGFMWLQFVSDFELRFSDLTFAICFGPRGFFRNSDFGFMSYETLTDPEPITMTVDDC